MTTDTVTRTDAPAAAGGDHATALRFITCGSVDDGKSTLIGRLLWEARQVFDDQLAALEAAVTMLRVYCSWPGASPMMNLRAGVARSR